MQLQQMFNLVSKRSFFSRDDDEVWAAISSVSKSLFLEVQEENRGFFIVFDTSSLQLQPNVEEYALPSGCSQIVRLRERLTSTQPYSIIWPADDLNDPDLIDAQFPEFASDLDGPNSDFEYYGPYLDFAGAQTVAKVQKIRIEPIPQDARATELAYIAKFLEITSAASAKVLPDESDDAVVYGATVICLGANEGVEQQLENNQGFYKEAKIQFMKWVRRRQQQRVRQVETYVNDLD